MEKVIVSRHPAAIQFIRSEIGPDADGVPVLASAQADDVKGKVVYGNLPLHLAQEARAVFAVEFAGDPPRGREYELADMLSAGAKLVPYCVCALGADEV